MRAGITGHQHLETNLTWCRSKVQELIEINQVTYGITSLAQGADQLYAECLVEREVALHVVVPCQHYEDAFEINEARLLYLKYLQLASHVTQLKYPKPSEEAFYRAGQTVVDLSDIMFAIWDGRPSRGLGGTADIVRYARSKRKPVFHMDPVHNEVHRIFA
jgi:hypothetical protein